eukprot:c11531_g1_i3.p1 GENE.c11531_g1_i3~~c11531_g1_i3.p1  ORF type:complete len:309 (-),score=69.92 c11531_g1_i3:1249-2175(-)
MASSAVAPFMRIENLLCASPAGMFGLTPTTATFTTSTTATFTGPTPSSSSLSLSFDANSNNIMNKMSKKIGNLSPSREVQIPTVPTTEKKISLKCALAITNKTHNSNMVTKKPQELLSQSRHLLLSQPQPQLEHQQQPKRVHSSNHHQQGHPIKLFSVGPSPFQSLPMTKITSVQNSLQQLQPQQPQPHDFFWLPPDSSHFQSSLLSSSTSFTISPCLSPSVSSSFPPANAQQSVSPNSQASILLNSPTHSSKPIHVSVPPHSPSASSSRIVFSQHVFVSWQTAFSPTIPILSFNVTTAPRYHVNGVS